MNWPLFDCSKRPITSRVAGCGPSLRLMDWEMVQAAAGVWPAAAGITVYAYGTTLMISGLSLNLLRTGVGLAACLAVAMARPQHLPAVAERQASQPQREQERDGRRPPQDRPERSEGERGGGPEQGRGGPPRGMWQEPTQEQWEEALGFLRDNSPRRLDLYDKAVSEWREQQQQPVAVDELPRSIRGARARIYGRVQMLRMIERGDPQLYAIALDQFRLEDQIIGALHDARQAHNSGDEAAATEATQRAQEAVRQYAQGTILEREQRIARMREELAREERRLEEDRSQTERLVERLYERFRRSVPGNQGPRDGEGRGDGDRGGGQREERGGDGESKAGG